MNRIKARKGEVSHFSIIARRRNDGKISLGDTTDRIVDEWPEEADLDGDYYTYGLEYVEKQMEDGTLKRFYMDELDKLPDEPGLEWGNYL